MTDTLPWYAYLALGFMGLFVLLFFLVILYAFLEGWWLSRQKVPSRFDRLESESDFDKSAIPAIAQQLGMTQVDRIPARVSSEILTGMRGDWKDKPDPGQMTFHKYKSYGSPKTIGKGAEFLDILSRKSSEGLFLLCNVRRAKEVVVGDSSGERGTKRYLQVDSLTVAAFRQTSEPYLPEFSTSPFMDALILKLYKLLGRKWFGHPRFEDDPEFHEKVLISAAEPEKVRPFLTDRVRKVLKENSDLTTVIRGRTIVVYSDGHPVKHMMRRAPEDGDIVETCKVLPPKEWPRFCEAAMSIVKSLQQADSIRSDHTP